MGCLPGLLHKLHTSIHPSTHVCTSIHTACTLFVCGRCCSAAPCQVSIWERGSDGCQLHAAGEAAPGLLPVLAWQPNGRHLHVAQQPPAAEKAAAATGAPTPAARQTLRERAGATAAVKAQEQLLNPVTADGGHPLPHIKLYERNGLQHGGFDLRAHGNRLHAWLHRRALRLLGSHS